MSFRLEIAYGLIALMVVAAMVVARAIWKRQKAHRRMMRGVRGDHS